MPRRPGGGVSPPDSVEAGLRDLVRGAGPDVGKLSRGDTGGLRNIMREARTPTSWPAETKAAVVLTVIEELVAQLPNSRWRAAALAAFRRPAEAYPGSEYDSLASRWTGLARLEGAGEERLKQRVEAHRGYWIAAAAYLAERVEQRLTDLNHSAHGWQAYGAGVDLAPTLSLPISFDRSDVLFRFDGYRGVESISYRWLIAHAPVDHYDAVGWYYAEPDAPIEIVPLANCALEGPLSELPQGGRSAMLRFSHTLEVDERYFFAYMTRFNSELPCRPTILYETRGLLMRSLVIRAQFDPKALPARCWRFDVEAQNEGWQRPDVGAPELLSVGPNGYVAHEFSLCGRGRKYGLRWEW